MNSLVNMIARFLPMRKFRSRRKARTRAFLTAGYPRQGGGSFMGRSTKLRHTINITYEGEYTSFLYFLPCHPSLGNLYQNIPPDFSVPWHPYLFFKFAKKPPEFFKKGGTWSFF